SSIQFLLELWSGPGPCAELTVDAAWRIRKEKKRFVLSFKDSSPSFDRAKPFQNCSGQRRNDFPLVRMIGSEGDEHELRAVWQFDVGRVVPRFTRPARF